jgi:hypothetical protein
MTMAHSAVWATLLVFGGSAALAYQTPASAAPRDELEKQAREARPSTKQEPKRNAGPLTKRVSSGGVPVTLILPREQSDARRVAKEIRQFGVDESGNQLLLPLVAPPSVREVAKLLPKGAVAEGNTITLADGTTAVLVKVDEGDDHSTVFKKAFDAAAIKRDRLVTVIKGLPKDAIIRLAPPDGEPVVVTGDLNRAAEAIRKAPADTRVIADFDQRTIAYPRLK